MPDISEAKKILIVCSGNSCRSIMAEGYLKKRLNEESLDIQVESAGTLGIEGMPPTEETLKVLEEDKIGPDGLVSTSVTSELIAWADAILVMEYVHKTILVTEYGSDVENKIFCLGGFDQETRDINIIDPITKPLEFYRSTYNIIKRASEEMIKCLK